MPLGEGLAQPALGRRGHELEERVDESFGVVGDDPRVVAADAPEALEGVLVLGATNDLEDPLVHEVDRGRESISRRLAKCR